MTDKLNLDLSKAALKTVKLGIESGGDNSRFSYGLGDIILDTPNGVYGIFAGLVDLSITLTEALADTMGEPIETILAMLEEDADTKWNG